MTCFERDIRMKEQNFDVKLQSTEDAHRNAMMELRQMLAAQQRMSAKYDIFSFASVLFLSQ